MTVAEDPSASRGQANETLLRLVRFAAAACDGRYAFVVAVDGPGESEAGLRHMTFWAARDYGLRMDCRTLELPGDHAVPSTPVSWMLALREIWPEESELSELTLCASCIALPLFDDRSRVVGYMGILDPGRPCPYAGDRLPPLGRLAGVQVVRWTRASS